MRFLQITTLLTLLARLGLAQGDNSKIIVQVIAGRSRSQFYPESGECILIGVK
ncbi:hypothetical protein EYZ11_002014 [Aspergillus tanneri]|uniref:Uncharacterized protein n=1 Tax=Aspergillus tanneri TaxID=1220188 RepID=A0A4S3JS12_9EURO|nr:hypothetical protein EYZ11_002014 [Aspergillus tanneri]